MDGIVGTTAEAEGGAMGGVGTARGAEAVRASLETVAAVNAEENDIAAAAQGRSCCGQREAAAARVGSDTK